MPDNVNPDVMALAVQIAKNKAAQMAAHKQELAAKYPHALVETLHMLPAENKLAVRIRCSCGDTSRVVRTSDLFQVTSCEACSKAAKAARKASKKALLAKAMEMVANGEVK